MFQSDAFRFIVACLMPLLPLHSDSMPVPLLFSLQWVSPNGRYTPDLDAGYDLYSGRFRFGSPGVDTTGLEQPLRYILGGTPTRLRRHSTPGAAFPLFPFHRCYADYAILRRAASTIVPTYI